MRTLAVSLTPEERFRDFVTELRPRLRRALGGTFGFDVGDDATAEAFAFAWENWERVSEVRNAGAYLYGVGRHKAIAALNRRPVALPEVPNAELPWVEPGLPAALSRLSERQRTVVVLVYCFDWTLAEVATLLGLSKGTIQIHARRGLARLRSDLGGKK